MEKKFRVTGMTCAACAAGIQKTVSKMQGVEHADVSLMGECMRADFDESKVSSEDIVKAVQELGYGAEEEKEGAAPAEKEEKKAVNSFAEEAKKLRTRFFTSLIFLIPLLYFTMGHMLGAPLPAFWAQPSNFALVQLLLTTPILVINFAFFRSGVRAAIKRVPNMDTLVSLGAAVSYLYSVVIMFVIPMRADADMHFVMGNLFFESAAMVLTLVTLGKWLEARSKRKTGEEVEKLLRLAPDTVTVEREGVQKTVRLSELVPGDIVVVRQGDSIPVDGTVLSGQSFVDKSAITGESLPVEVAEGDYVTSASVNKGNLLRVRAEKVGQETVLSRIVKMVQEAGTSKAPIEKTVDKIAGIFVPVVLLIALLTFGVWMILWGTHAVQIEVAQILKMAISVLVISCPCALGLATPVAVMAATGRGAAIGILYKDADALQRARGIRTVLLDKTATITEGKPRVTDLLVYAGTEREALSLACGIEQGSNHPLAECVLEKGKEEGIEAAKVTSFRYVSGKGALAEYTGLCMIGNRRLLEENGVSCVQAEEDAARLAKQGKTLLYLASGGKLVALIGVADTVKPTSAEAVRSLKELGIQPVMLTGDGEAAAHAVAQSVGIDRVYAEVLPEDKLRAVTENKKSGITAMVGDGINDSPALKEADVGIAMGNGTDVAIDSADVVLVGGDLRAVGAAVELSKAAMRNIKENLFWAFFYNVLCIPIAAGVLYAVGFVMEPMYGALAMSLSSVCVVGNALRLMRFKPKFLRSAQADKGDDNMKRILKIEGMSCSHCSARVEQALNSVEGVSASVDLKKKRATVEGDAPDEVLCKAVEDAGYKVAGIKKE